jgi:hypothetical protein
MLMELKCIIVGAMDWDLIPIIPVAPVRQRKTDIVMMQQFALARAAAT